MPPWNEMRERWRKSPAAALGLAVLWIGLLKILESAPKYDVLFQDFVQMMTAGLHRHAPPRHDVMVVALTDAAVQKRTLTNAPANRFPREVLFKVFTEVAKAKPAVIVMDLFLDEQVAGTDLLTNICEFPSKVFLPRDISGWDLVPQLARLSCIETAPAFYRPDSKGIVRETPLYREGEKKESTLPAAVARYLRREEPSSMKRRIHFTAAGADAIKHFYAEGLFEHQGPSVFPGLAEFVKTNSAVIIAPFYSFSDDTFRVPGWAGPSNTMAGGDLLALSIRTFLDDSLRNLTSRQMFWFEMMLAAIGLTAGKFPRLGLGGDARQHIVPLVVLLAATIGALSSFYIPVAGPAVYYYTMYKVGKEWKRRLATRPDERSEPPRPGPELESGSRA